MSYQGRSRMAKYKYSKSASEMSKQGYCSAYNIFPPLGYSFFESDEAIHGVVATCTGLLFAGSTRMRDRHFFTVKTRYTGIFRVHANPRQKAKREDFLRKVARLARSGNNIPEYVYVACDEFLETFGFE